MITGMRSWIHAMDFGGAVVISVQDSSGSPDAGSRHASHSAASANGVLLAGRMKYGCLSRGPSCIHS